MAVSGKKPKSIAEKMASGARIRSHTTLIPTPKSGEMMLPREVESNQRANDYWNMFVTNTAPGHLLPIDAPLLARLCLCLAMADEAQEHVEKGGLLLKTKNGAVIQNPYLPIANKQTELARKLAAELGVVPATRNRVGKYGAEEPRSVASPWDALKSDKEEDELEDAE